MARRAETGKEIPAGLCTPFSGHSPYPCNLNLTNQQCHCLNHREQEVTSCYALKRKRLQKRKEEPWLQSKFKKKLMSLSCTILSTEGTDSPTQGCRPGLQAWVLELLVILLKPDTRVTGDFRAGTLLCCRGYKLARACALPAQGDSGQCLVQAGLKLLICVDRHGRSWCSEPRQLPALLYLNFFAEFFGYFLGHHQPWVVAQEN